MFHDYSRFEKKNGGHRIRFFRNWGRKLQFFADFCMCFNCKSKGSLHQTVVAKKLYLEFFSKTTRTFLMHFSFNRERKKWGSPCSFSLHEQKTVSSRHWRGCEKPWIWQVQTIRCTQARAFDTVCCIHYDSTRRQWPMSTEHWTLNRISRVVIAIGLGSEPPW